MEALAFLVGDIKCSVMMYNGSMDMMKILMVGLVLVMGGMMGSFGCCQVWRLRYRQKGKKELGRWSVCLACGHRLRWWENVPVVSWLILRGKCSKCGRKIGVMEILAEVGMIIVYGLILGYFWGDLWRGGEVEVMTLLRMVVLMVMMVVLLILFLYDARWGEMPTTVLWAGVGVAVVYRMMTGVESWASFAGGVGILAGMYLGLYWLSRERLVGAGDWILCLALSITLGNWWLALLVLFLANFLGSVVMMPVAMKTKKHTIHFAPFLISAFLVVFIFQDVLKTMVIG